MSNTISINDRLGPGGLNEVVTTYTDPSTGQTVLVGGDGKLMPFASVSARAPLKNGQPFGITRAVQNPGKLVARFVDSEITVIAGTPAHADHTGYDAAGAETGIVSITGQPNLLKITPAADTSEGIRFTTFATSVPDGQLVDGKFGMWVYVENLPGYEAGGTPTGYIKVVLTTQEAGLTGNALDITFTGNQVREGWNFLVFIMRNPLAYQDGTGEIEYNPYGISVVNYGTGQYTDIVNSPITKIEINWVNMYDAGTACNLYFDSIVTGWETQAQVVLGCDAMEADIVDYVLPIFEEYKWVGYVAAPARVYSSGSTILYDVAGSGGWTNMVARAATLKSARWDCINHTMNHRALTTLTDAAEIAYEILGVQSVYSAAGWTQGNEFYASPQSSTSRLSQAVIKNCGIKLQRHAKKSNVQLSAWGVDNIDHVGASDISSNSGGAYQKVTAGANTNVSGLQKASKLQILTDVMIAYGATWFPFWHYVTELGDTGSGEDLTGDDLYITRSAFTAWCAYVRQQQIAGNLRVCDGVTGFYYGVGQ